MGVLIKRGGTFTKNKTNLKGSGRKSHLGLKKGIK